MTNHEIYITIPASSITHAGMTELQHGLHVAIKRIMADFEAANIDAVAAKARLADIAEQNKKLLESYIDHVYEQRQKEPF